MINEDELEQEYIKFVEGFLKKTANRHKYLTVDPVKKILYNIKARAKKLNIEFNLTVQDIIIPECCPYLGIKLSTERMRGRKPNSVSIDRIDPTKGYVSGNVEVVSDLANRMKQEASPEQLILFAETVLKRYGNLRT